ncbi:hypothetical protein [Pseudomonas sp. 51_B]|uniref:hypothetical protein n=1 Tax=Pseudomonas sp. 51_B TaxID=2813573 RepID=UPI001A9D12AB|nr:hypothetical protein [Pseudomonas sp. 51_B]
MNMVNGLLVIVALLAGLSLYFWLRLKSADSREDVQPLDTGFVAWVALVFIFIIVGLFVYFGENLPKIPTDIGQIGDFVGGLTNPVLSFLALLVLLRTTRIQTLESRKTTNFMRAQQEILEIEKFESTFFQLLNQLETHCERHFREITDGKSKGDIISARLWGSYKELAELPETDQLEAANKHMSFIADDPLGIILAQRAMRVVKFIDDSRINKEKLASYAEILRDTIYPAECAIIMSISFESRAAREALKKWGIVDLTSGHFPCPAMEHFFFPPAP